MNRKMLLLGVLLSFALLAVAVPASAGAEDFVEFGKITDLFTMLFVIFLPIILVLFVIDLFLTRVLHYEGIFARVFQI